MSEEPKCKRSQIALAEKNQLVIETKIEVLSKTPVDVRTSKQNQELVELSVELDNTKQALIILKFKDNQYHNPPKELSAIS